MHGIALIDDAAQMATLRQLGARFATLLLDRARLALRTAQVEQVAHGGEQARIVPRLGDVIGRAGLHELDRHLQMSPGGEQDDQQVGVEERILAEQLHAFFAAGRFAAEVHVLEHRGRLISRSGSASLSAGRSRR